MIESLPRGFKCELCDDFDSADADLHANPMGNGDKVVNKIISFIRFVMSHRMALDRHKKEVHDVAKEYPCELCDHISGNKEDMKKHQEMRHSDNWWPQSTASEDLPGSSESEVENEASKHSEDVVPRDSHKDILGNPILEDEIAKQIDDKKGNENDESLAHGLEESVTKEHAGVEVIKEKPIDIGRFSSSILGDVSETDEETDESVINSPQDKTDPSQHFTLQKGTKILTVQCVHCTMLFTIKKGDYSGFIFHMAKAHNISCEDPNLQSSNVQLVSGEPSNPSASKSPREEISNQYCNTEQISHDTTDNCEKSRNVSKIVEADLDTDSDDNSENSGNVSKIVEAVMDPDFDNYENSRNASKSIEADMDSDSKEKPTVIDIPQDNTDLSKHFTVQRGTKIPTVQCVHCTRRFIIQRSDYSGLIYHMGKRHNITCENPHSPSRYVQVKSAEPSNQRGSKPPREETCHNEEISHDTADNSDNIGNVSKTAETDMDTEAIETLQECHGEKTSMQAADLDCKKSDQYSDLVEITIIEGDDDDSPVVIDSQREDEHVNAGDIIEISDEDSESGKESDQDSESETDLNDLNCDLDLDRIAAAAERQRTQKKLENKHTQRRGPNTLECKYCTVQFLGGDKGGLRYHLSKIHNFSEEDTSIPPKAFVSESTEFINPERYQDGGVLNPVAEEKESVEDTKIEVETLELSSVSVAPTSTFALTPWSQRKCVLCHKIVLNQKDLEYHMLEHYMPQLMSQLPNIPSASGPFICAECGHHFPNVSKLLWHYGFFHKYIMKFIKEYELQARRGRRWTN